MNISRSLGVIIFCLFFYTSSAQLSKDQRLQFIQNFEQVRNDLLVGDLDGLESISLMLEVFADLVGNKEKALSLLFDLQFNKKVKNLDHSELYFSSKDKAIKEFITEEIYDLVGEYSLLISFIDDNFFDNKYPYSLRVREIIEEMDFYDIHEDEIIAEIGAGRGLFSFSLGMLDMNLDIIVNELEPNLLSYSRDLFEDFTLVNNQVSFVKGNKKSTNISKKVDKVIIRNTFHHFKKKKQMLESIYLTLKDDGILYIREQPHVRGTEKYCSKQIEETSIRNYIAKSQFEIVNEIRLDGWLHLKCSKVSK